jgi:hypothetical protein
MIAVKTMEQMNYSNRKLWLRNVPLPVNSKESFSFVTKCEKLRIQDASHLTIWPAPLAKLWLGDMQVSA